MKKLFFCFSVLASICTLSAQCNSTALQNQLVENATPYISGGYEFGDISCVDLYDEGTHTFTLTLSSGTGSHIVVGGCDGDCFDIDFYLYDSNWNLLAKDIAANDDPAIRITSGYSGTFYLKVKMADCRRGPCGTGIVLMK